MPEQRVRDPAHSLSRIKQAIYILTCISDGRTWNDIVEDFDDDEQLVSIWINYLKERNYLNAFLAVTDEGSFLKNFTDSAAGEITTLRR